MKQPILIAGLLLLTAAASHAQLSDTTKVVFDRAMNAASLDRMKKDVAAQGITLKFDETHFSMEGQLDMIAFTVRDGSGREYQAGTNHLVIDQYFGFEFTGRGDATRIQNVGTIGYRNP